ncbi:hypothetical protein D3C80_1212770 [compost metagenome]
MHLLDAQARHCAHAEALGDHAADGHQLVALKGHLQFAMLASDAFLQQQAHRRRALQGDETLFQQLCPAHFERLGQRTVSGHHRDKAVGIEGNKVQAIEGLRLEGNAQLDSAVA